MVSTHSVAALGGGNCWPLSFNTELHDKFWVLPCALQVSCVKDRNY